MNEHFRNRVAIVTGGGAGIGRALCEQLAELGARVVVADINGAAARDVAKGTNSTHAEIDVSDAARVDDLVRRTVAEHGSLDFMFNNAGIAAVGELRDGNLADFRRVMEVNFFGVVNGTMSAYRVMLQQGSGHIVNTSSMCGLMPTPLVTAYSSSKWAINGFSLSLREEAATLGVRVSAACPALVKTEIGERNTYWNIRKKEYLQWLPFMNTALSPAQTAKAILRGTKRNRALIIAPAYARIGWYVQTFFPSLFAILLQRTLKSFRAMRIEP